ncbi:MULTISPECIES: hypothetical protein [Paracoccus]|uniref:hypothetical protein n=1 Tax=Paracoccus TaxID=265 RepID=UPI000E27B6C7|nr:MULTISPECIES: hypothetical protein [Paracoccus]
MIRWRFRRRKGSTPTTRARALMFGLGQPACLGHAIIRATLVQLLGVLEAFAPEAGTPPARWSPFAQDHLPALGIRFEG